MMIIKGKILNLKLPKFKVKNLKGYLFILPSLIGFAALYLIPFISGLRYSFSRSGFDKTFVGFKNYAEILDGKAFQLALKNNILFMIIGIPTLVLISFVLSLLIHELKAPKYIKLAIVLPIATPSATVAGFFRKIFGTGAFNIIDSEYAMIVIILIYIWRNTGYNLIIYLAGLAQMDKSILEASKIDGANYLQRLKNVTIPLMTPATVFVFIISIINSFKVFKDVYILQGNYPNSQLYMLQHYMNNKFRDLQYEKLTTASYIFAIVIFTFALVFFYIDKRHSVRVGDE